MGHVFQGRFKGILVEKESYLLELSRYIVLNPVRAHMVSCVDEWPWSSYLATVGQVLAPIWLNTDWILSVFGDCKLISRNKYQKFVHEADLGYSPWEDINSILQVLALDFFKCRRTAA